MSRKVKKTHDDHRRNLCLFCLGKGDQSLPKQDYSQPPSTLIEKILKIIPSYLEHRSILPESFCRSCRRIVYDCIKNDKDLQAKVDYNEIIKVLQGGIQYPCRQNFIPFWPPTQLMWTFMYHTLGWIQFQSISLDTHVSSGRKSIWWSISTWKKFVRLTM